MASKSSKRRRKRKRAAAAKRPDPASTAAGGGDEREKGAAPASGASAGGGFGRRRVEDERPPAPWGSFPLVELAVLTGLVMLVLGLFVVDGDRSGILIGTGLALGSIGGFELAIREHFAGYRSHTLILAGVPAAVVLAVLFYLGPEGLPPAARAAVAAVVFAGAAVLLVKVFRDRSGGESFRFAGFRRR